MKLISIDKLVEIREKLKKEGKKVVFTNGCFDILHRGHVEYLSKAKQLGDVLIVGVNSDSSVKRIKGNKRPIIPQDDRIAVLSAIEFIDYIVVFEDDTPYELIKKLVPDVLVKGSDWSIDEVVGRDVVESEGGKVILVELTPGRSTTNIIQTIIERYCNNAKGG